MSFEAELWAKIYNGVYVRVFNFLAADILCVHSSNNLLIKS